jgi:hypothetical protein
MFKVFTWLLYGTVEGIVTAPGYTRVVSPGRLGLELKCKSERISHYILELAELGLVDVKSRQFGFWVVTLNVPEE